MDKEMALLKAAAREAIAGRWEGSRVIAELEGAQGNPEWLVETTDKQIVLVAKKSQSGLFKRAKISVHWQVAKTPEVVLQSILKAMRANRDLTFVSYTARRAFDKKDKKKHTHTNVTLAKSGQAFTWADVFPDDELPDGAKWVITDQKVLISGDELVVKHQLKQGKQKQMNEYHLSLKQISMALVESTFAYKTFPFNIPHTHKIIEDGKVTYDRPLADWDAHANQKGLVEDSSVTEKSCSSCRTKFFDTSTQSLCYSCMQKAHGKSVEQAKQLIHEARALSTNADWKETSEKFKALQMRWQKLGPMPADASEKLWQEFRQYSQKFFDRQSQHFDGVNAEREKNAKKARNLIAKAKTLQKSGDKRAAREEIIALQKEWKTVNPLPKAESETLWQQFNGVCQSFFDRAK